MICGKDYFVHVAKIGTAAQGSYLNGVVKQPGQGKVEVWSRGWFNCLGHKLLLHVFIEASFLQL